MNQYLFRGTYHGYPLICLAFPPTCIQLIAGFAICPPDSTRKTSKQKQQNIMLYTLVLRVIFPKGKTHSSNLGIMVEQETNP